MRQIGSVAKQFLKGGLLRPQPKVHQGERKSLRCLQTITHGIEKVHESDGEESALS
jgi:hypothetical protein